MLHFEEDEHIYRWNGIIVPSVTQALQEWVKVKLGRYDYYVHTIKGTAVNAVDFEAAGDFGTAVHRACHYIMLDQLDWATVDDALIPCLVQFEQWIEDFKFKPEYIEHQMYSKKLGYAGTADIRGTILNNKIVLPDIKTGIYSMVGPQTAAYEELFKETERKRKAAERYVLYLPKDGSKYKFEPVKAQGDWRFFLNRLSQWRYHNQGA